jgi:hypothetical protein
MEQHVGPDVGSDPGSYRPALTGRRIARFTDGLRFREDEDGEEQVSPLLGTWELYVDGGNFEFIQPARRVQDLEYYADPLVRYEEALARYRECRDELAERRARRRGSPP